MGKNGTPHLQGYTYFRNAKSFTAIKSLLPGQPHIEVCHHSPQQNADYCKKDGDFREWGICPYQGHRSDLAALAAMVKEGGKQLVVEERPDQWIKWERGIKSLINEYALLNPIKRKNPIINVYWGPPGVGKSYRSEQEANDGQRSWTYPKSTNGQPYALGYSGETHIIIEDFYGWLPWTFLLRLTDRYDMFVNTQGNWSVWNATHIWFTSNRHPSEWYKDWDWKPLKQRILERSNPKGKIINLITPYIETE